MSYDKENRTLDLAATITFIGLVGQVVVPGVGTVFTDIGGVTIDAKGKVVFTCGPHHQFLAGDTPGLCAALA